MTLSGLLPAAGLFPLLLVLPAVLPRLRSCSLWWLPAASLPALAAGLLLPDAAAVAWPNLYLGAAWQMDPVGRVFLLFSAVGWGTAGLFALVYFQDRPRNALFAVPFLMAMSGNFLLICAADVVLFYTGFALMGFASWGLIIHSATPEAFRAGRLYLLIVLLGESLILPGIIAMSLEADSIHLQTLRLHVAANPEWNAWLLLLAVGFGLKAGLVPLHSWLPLAHPVAPSPASAVLSGCMIKTGLLAWIRLLPIGEIPLPALADLLTLPAVAGMLGGLVCALLQPNPKALLAYTSLSKIGLMILLLTLAMRDPALASPCIAAVLFLATFHALHKSALFLGTSVTEGMGRPGRILLLLLCASYAGLPFTAGALSKDFLYSIISTPLQPLGENLSMLLWIEALLTVLVLARFFRMTRPVSRFQNRQLSRPAGVWTLSVFVAVFLPVMMTAAPTYGFAVDLPKLSSFSTGGSGMWTGLLIAALMGAAGLTLSRTFPPGDWIHLLPTLSHPARNSVRRFFIQSDQALTRGAGGMAFISVLLILLGMLLSSRFFS